MNEWLKKIDGLFEDLFLKKLPSLPKNAKQIIVKALPWLILVLTIIALPGIIAGLGLGTLAVPFWVFGGARSLGWMFAFLLNLLKIVLTAAAIPALFNNKKKGWELLFYSSLLGILSNVLFVSLGGLVGVAIGFYFLYQIKSSYK